jgi:hypothetical protein
MMNLVDLIAGQLTSGDVLGKLAGLAGASEAQTKTATSAAIPALLSALSGLAGTSKGADSLASALGGLDLGMLGNLAGALGGGQASGIGSLGGNLLGSLLGAGGTAKIVDAIAAFAGIKPGIMRTLLNYLAPVVLGMVAKQFSGRPTGADISRLFADQSSNIKAAMPRGLSLADVGKVAETAKGGMPAWLPLAALVALAAGAWWFLNKDKMAPVAEPVKRMVVEAERKAGPVVETVRDEIVTDGKTAIEAVTDMISIDPKFLEAGKTAGSLFNGLTKVLTGVTDIDSAKAALPELEKLAPMLSTLETEAGKLPADEQPAFAEVIGKNIGLLQKVIDTAMAIPGVKELLGPVVTPMVESLTKLTK